MDSSRLPGKVLTDISGKPMLAHVIERAIAIRGVDDVVVATTMDPDDAPISALAISSGALTFAGHTTDVLDRYYQAATLFEADAIVRLTADCPLLDPVLCEEILDRFTAGDWDYVSNVMPATFPDGLDTEVITYRALKISWEVATLPSDREHVTTYIRTNPELFKVSNVAQETNLSYVRWTVDEPDDLEFIRAVFENLPKTGTQFPSMNAILGMLKERPEIAAMHTDHSRNEGWATSIAIDNHSPDTDMEGSA